MSHGRRELPASASFSQAAQLQVRYPPGSVRSSLLFPVTATQSLPSTPKPQPAPHRPVGLTLLNTPAIAPPRQAASIPPPMYPHSQSSLAKRAPSPPMATAPSPTPARSPIPLHMRFGVTPTPRPQSMSTGAAPLTPNLPLSISKPNSNVVIPSSSVSMSPSIPRFLFNLLLSNPLDNLSHPPFLGQPIVAWMNGNIMAPSTPPPVLWNPTLFAPKKLTINDWEISIL